MSAIALGGIGELVEEVDANADTALVATTEGGGGGEYAYDRPVAFCRAAVDLTVFVNPIHADVVVKMTGVRSTCVEYGYPACDFVCVRW